MKKAIAAMFLAVSLAASAWASLTAELDLSENSGRLWARVTLAGIADCPTSGSVTIVFTSPDEKVAESSEFEAPWRSCSAYGGTARTRAYRTVRRKSGDAVGVWKVTVKAGDTVLASGEYEVK